MASSVASLHSQTSLKAIFRTLQNQAGDIFSDAHNAHSASITACLENLGHLITPDNEDTLDDLGSFIRSGVCHIVRNYETNRAAISPSVLNFLMTAIRSYNHIVALGGGGGDGSAAGAAAAAGAYRLPPETCQGASSAGNAFLVQVLVPLIDAGALHVFPIGVPLVFDVKVPESFIMRSPSPKDGPRRPSMSFGRAVKAAKTARRRYRRQRRVELGAVSASSSSGSDSSNSNGGRGGGGKRSKCSRRIKRRTLKYIKK